MLANVARTRDAARAARIDVQARCRPRPAAESSESRKPRKRGRTNAAPPSMGSARPLRRALASVSGRNRPLPTSKPNASRWAPRGGRLRPRRGIPDVAELIGADAEWAIRWLIALWCCAATR
jgi:hypothetical protein